MNNLREILKAKRIAIIGCPGSGKTTFSVSLNNILKKPLYHLDLIYWGIHWQRTDEASWIGKIQELVERPTWIIDGNYINTLEIRMSKADLIIFFDYKPLTCLWHSLKRIFSWDRTSKKSYQKMTHLSRPSIRLQLKLMGLILKFKKNQRHRIFEMIQFHNKTVILLKNKRDALTLLNQLHLSAPAS
jgi:adenylate kinase family enzyme